MEGKSWGVCAPVLGSRIGPRNADVAQLVERRLPKPKVAGSTPVVRFVGPRARRLRHDPVRETSLTRSVAGRQFGPSAGGRSSRWSCWRGGACSGCAIGLTGDPVGDERGSALRPGRRQRGRPCRVLVRLRADRCLRVRVGAPHLVLHPGKPAAAGGGRRGGAPALDHLPLPPLRPRPGATGRARCGEDRTFATTNLGFGDVITQDFALSGSTTCVSSEVGLVIGADGVDVNLNGHALSGPAGRFRERPAVSGSTTARAMTT